MDATRVVIFGSLSGVLICAFGSPLRSQASARNTPYLKMAPLGQYLMDRNAEIALARSAAPEAISRDATVLVLGRHGYEIAVSATGGFVCLVLRSWAASFDDPAFWNPKIRGPACYNPPAARSVLPVIEKRTEMILAGLSKPQVFDGLNAAVEKQELEPPEPGSMSFMMSKNAYLTDAGDHNLAHLMFEVPPMAGAAWGAGLPHSPVLLLSSGGPDPMTEFAVPVGRWSDGSAAPLPH